MTVKNYQKLMWHINNALPVHCVQTYWKAAWTYFPGLWMEVVRKKSGGEKVERQ